MLMDETTLLEFRSLWVEEPANTRFSGALANLNRSEQVVYQSLREGTYGRCVRLEQERISYRWVIDKLEPFT